MSSARSITSSRPTREPAKSRVDNYRSINALAESTIGLFKNEAIRDGSPFRTGPLKTIDDVEWVTAGWVDWYNNRRLHSTLGNVPPDEFEAVYYAGHEAPHHPVLAPA